MRVWRARKEIYFFADPVECRCIDFFPVKGIFWPRFKNGGKKLANSCGKCEEISLKRYLRVSLADLARTTDQYFRRSFGLVTDRVSSRTSWVPWEEPSLVRRNSGPRLQLLFKTRAWRVLLSRKYKI